jgi:hypothetical protein
MRTDDQGRRLCSATAKSTGQHCRAPAVIGATICRMHGAAKGTPGRDAADDLMLRELIGPALWKLKEMLHSKDTPPAVMLSVVREILDRSGYSETARISRAQLENELQELEAELTPDERQSYRHTYSVPEADGVAHECELCTR